MVNCLKVKVLSIEAFIDGWNSKRRHICIMKSSLHGKKELFSTTPISNFPTKENYLFSSVDNLAADHDVKVSSTMIKVTYKKTLKDQNISIFTNNIDFCQESVLIKNMSSSATKRKDKVLTNGHAVFSNKTLNTSLSASPESSSSIKKNDYMDGLDLSGMDSSDEIADNVTPTSNEGDFKRHLKTKMLKKFSISSEGCEGKIESIRFLKNVDVDKIKDSIVEDFESEKSNSKGLKAKIVINKNLKAHNDLKSTTNNMTSVIVKRKMTSDKGGYRSKQKKVKPIEEKKVEESNKKPILEVDPDLPSGWTRHIRTRNKGCFDEKHIVYVVSPQGKKFRFKWKLRKYLEKTHSSLDPDQFFFGLYRRTKPSTNVPAGNEEQNTQDSGMEISGIVDKSTSEITKSKPSSSNLIQNESSDEGKSNDRNLDWESNIDNKILKTASADGRELLLHDPDLPFGWKRIIKSNSSSGKLQVHIISPDGKIFRRRYRLSEYLTKHQFTHNLDRFYFGLYPKKDNSDDSKIFPEDEEDSSDDSSDDNITESNVIFERKNVPTSISNISGGDKRFSSDKETSECSDEVSPMYNDNLPEGWKREVRVRTVGDSAGRIEVIIISPDRRRFRTKKDLEHYFERHNLNHNAEDFDFSLFGKRRHTISEPKDANFDVKKRVKKAYTKPVPDFDFSKLKKSKTTLEGEMIAAVSGLMMGCDLSSLRSERRSLLPKKEQEQILKKHLEFVGEAPLDDSDIPTRWVQTLVNCRSELKPLEPEAATAIAEKTKDFLKEICHRAFENSQHPEEGLRYEDIAEFIDNSKFLLPLKSLIPRKITYKEYIRLNRPKQFLSFT